MRGQKCGGHSYVHDVQDQSRFPESQRCSLVASHDTKRDAGLGGCSNGFCHIPSNLMFNSWAVQRNSAIPQSLEYAKGLRKDRSPCSSGFSIGIMN